MPTRKTDRRTQYTINIVKEAFLELINDHPYSQITVTQVCRQAEITRSTFYLHFNNLTDVLNVVLDDALMISKNSAESLPNISELLMDPDLSEYIIGRIASHERGRMIPLIQQRTGLNSQDAETLFNYTLHGSFAINKRHHFIKDDEWYHEVELLNLFINAGYRTFKK